MQRISLDGLSIAYELHGSVGAPAIALTPGGRFAMDSPGLPELAQALAAAGRRVLLWDRPNCGASDLSFEGDGESALQARSLIALIQALQLGPTALAAGSAGARVSLLAAALAPQAISHLALWWISGGLLSQISLAHYYCFESALAASRGGMAAVAALPAWAPQLQRNPRNRDILLAQAPAAFIAKMERWAAAFLPEPGSPIPGLRAADYARLSMPVLILRNGLSDLSHPRATSDELARCLPHAQVRDPPWPDDEWNRRSAYAAQHGSGHFAGWPVLAPLLLAFIAR